MARIKISLLVVFTLLLSYSFAIAQENLSDVGPQEIDQVEEQQGEINQVLNIGNLENL